jgi:hypothetical protein
MLQRIHNFLAVSWHNSIAQKKSRGQKMQMSLGVGAKLIKKGAPGYILEILEFVTPDGEWPHARARVRIMSHDLGVRLYSVSALMDPQLFTPAAAAQTA